MSDILFDLAAALNYGAARPNLNMYVPHDKQRIFHESMAPEKLFVGGNRSGKTTGGTVEAIYWLRGNHPDRPVPPPPIRSRAIGVDFIDGVERILKPEFQRWIPPSLLHNGSWIDSFRAETKTLTLTNGSFVEFMSYEQDIEKFAGTSRHFIYFDEEPPKAIFAENKMRLIDTDGSYWITMTPLLGMTWLYDDIYIPGIMGLNPNILVVEVKMEENPHIREEAIERGFSGLDENEVTARREGRFVQIGGVVFKQFSDEHVVEQIPPHMLKHLNWYVSMDHGLNNPTAFLWHAVSPNGAILTFHEHYQREWTIDRHANYVHARRKEWQKDPVLYVGDPAIKQRNAETGLSVQLAYSQRGIPIGIANNDVSAGINKMNQYLDTRKWLITDNCVNLIREMRRYRWDTYKSAKLRDDNNLKEKPKKLNDHAVDAARYLFTFMPDLEYEIESGIDYRPDVESFIHPHTPAYVDAYIDPTFKRVTEHSDFSSIDEHMGAIY